MRKRRSKKNNKIVATGIVLTIILLLVLLGINDNTITKFIKLSEVNITEKNLVTAKTRNETIMEEELSVYFIDVGQADSILVINKDEAMLIDAGNNQDGQDVVSFIKEKGITKLNYVIGTHPHEDHIGGLDDVINSDIKIENVIMPKIQTNTRTFEDVLDAVENKNLSITAPNKGDNFKIGESNCQVMTDSILDKNNLNLSSVVIRLEYGNNSFLFMGDSEEENEKTMIWPKTDVLKVGHHGSNTSTSESFLNQVRPDYAVIMVGKSNNYGLPKEKIIERLKNVNAQIYRTDEMGTIKITSDGNNIEVYENT